MFSRSLLILVLSEFLKGFETALLALCVVKYESRIRVSSVNKAAGV